jgi:Rubisco Assembly chaperone C-terminal domain
VAGKFPLATSVLATVPTFEAADAFLQINPNKWTGSWVSLPGWKVLMSAEDPIGIIAPKDSIPLKITGESKETIVVLDRSVTEWDEFHYFAIDRDRRSRFSVSSSSSSIPNARSKVVSPKISGKSKINSSMSRFPTSLPKYPTYMRGSR